MKPFTVLNMLGSENKFYYIVHIILLGLSRLQQLLLSCTANKILTTMLTTWLFVRMFSLYISHYVFDRNYSI